MSDDSIAVLFALGAAVAWGFSSVYVRIAQQYMPTSSGTLISLITGVLFTGMLVLALDFGAIVDLGWQSALVFAAVGIFNFPFGRYMNYLSIRHLGITRSTPILASVPVFSIAFSVLVLGESIRPATIIGTGLVLSGLYVTLRAPTAPPAAASNAE